MDSMDVHQSLTSSHVAQPPALCVFDSTLGEHCGHTNDPGKFFGRCSAVHMLSARWSLQNEVEQYLQWCLLRLEQSSPQHNSEISGSGGGGDEMLWWSQQLLNRSSARLPNLRFRQWAPISLVGSTCRWICRRMKSQRRFNRGVRWVPGTCRVCVPSSSVSISQFGHASIFLISFLPFSQMPLQPDRKHVVHMQWSLRAILCKYLLSQHTLVHPLTHSLNLCRLRT